MKRQAKMFFKAFYTAALIALLLSGCLPKAGIKPNKEPTKAVFTELFKQGGVTYGYNILYDGDYTKLSKEEQQRYVETELIEVTDYKTEVIYRCGGVVKYYPITEFEKTGDCLYFYTTEDKNEYSVYSYNRKTGMFRPIAEAPATNLVIPGGDYGYGWVAKDATLYAVDLKNGTVDEEKTYHLENSELLFYNEGQEFRKKVTRLYPGSSDTVVCLDVQYYSDETPDVPIRSYTYLFETISRTFVGPFENILLN